MCEKPPGQESEGAEPPKNPVAEGGEDEGGPLAGVFRFAMQPITLPLAGGVGTLFAGSLVMTLSLAAVLVHWAISPPSPSGPGGTSPPVIAQTEQRQVTLSQKAILFEEVPPARPNLCLRGPGFVLPCAGFRRVPVQKEGRAKGGLALEWGLVPDPAGWDTAPFDHGRCMHLSQGYLAHKKPPPHGTPQ